MIAQRAVPPSGGASCSMSKIGSTKAPAGAPEQPSSVAGPATLPSRQFQP
jgi:hypothetical protein